MWDAQFRWREGHRIRDRVVDDTWHRVASAAAAAEGAAADVWTMRFFAAFRSWRLLPEPSVMRCAGTGTQLVRQATCTATVNLRAFVRVGPEGEKTFDTAAFRGTAALALRLADDESCLWTNEAQPEPRVGLMGLGDTLDALGLRCTSEPAIGFCGHVAELLALGCLRGNLLLGMERGPAAMDGPVSQPGASGPARTRRVRLRHPVATRLQPQPELAMLANGTSGACCPVPDALCRPDADIVYRRVMQPWIDDPIDSTLIHR